MSMNVISYVSSMYGYNHKIPYIGVISDKLNNMYSPIFPDRNDNNVLVVIGIRDSDEVLFNTSNPGFTTTASTNVTYTPTFTVPGTPVFPTQLSTTDLLDDINKYRNVYMELEDLPLMSFSEDLYKLCISTPVYDFFELKPEIVKLEKYIDLNQLSFSLRTKAFKYSKYLTDKYTVFNYLHLLCKVYWIHTKKTMPPHNIELLSQGVESNKYLHEQYVRAYTEFLTDSDVGATGLNIYSLTRAITPIFQHTIEYDSVQAEKQIKQLTLNMFNKVGI